MRYVFLHFIHARLCECGKKCVSLQTETNNNDSMKAMDILRRVCASLWLPIKTNALFLVAMYVLGVLTEVLTLPAVRGAHVYDNLYLELFLDLYVVGVLLSFLPWWVRRWGRTLLAVVAYMVSMVDVYCFWKFKSTLTPTMLLLVGETDSREAGEFVQSYLSWELLTGPVGWIVALMVLHLLLALGNKQMGRWLRGLKRRPAVARWGRQLASAFVRSRQWLIPVLGLVVMASLLTWSVCSSAGNKAKLCKLMTGRSIGEVEHTLTDRDHAVLYSPLWRLTFSMYANKLAAQQIDRLVEGIDRVKVDSCSFRSPTIVLIIGESYSRHHSSLYGYRMPTTPRQQARERSGRLVRFTDVVTPWNLTSFVFKNMLSLHVEGQEGEWCDYPLFAEVFRKAGYHVTFLTNQFLPQAKEAVYDFSGGFFLNNPLLSQAQFDTRNTELHRYDSGLLADFDKIREAGTLDGGQPGNLVIFHLLGQHVSYKERYPRNRMRFFASDYESWRPELSAKQRKMVSHYDNATLYNDSIVDQICRRFDREDAIVVYVPDHGEECYEEQRGIICRNHSAAIDRGLAKYEFEIPFWIYCTRSYVRRHRDVYRQVVAAKNRPYMIDALPHLLLYLAGISSPDYREAYNVLSPDYDEHRPRMLKGSTDYDQLVDEAGKEVSQYLMGRRSTASIGRHGRGTAWPSPFLKGER